MDKHLPKARRQPTYVQQRVQSDDGHDGAGSTMETDSCCESRIRSDSRSPSVLSFNSERDTSVFLRDYGGRTFNSQNDLYFLPADEPEFDRLDKQHLMLLLSMGGLYAAPEAVRRAVAPEDGVQKAILDLGTGGGTWAMAMANEFPHVEVVGVDLAPSTSRPPPPNCRFEFDDVNLGLPHYHGCFDVVHARSCANGIKDYAAFVHEIALCLRPGGVALFTEGDFNLCDANKRPIESASEGDERGKSWFRRLLYEVYMLMEARGTSVVGGQIVDYGLGDHPAFDETGKGELFTCIGPWEVGETPEHTRQLNIIGTLMRQNSLEFARAWKPLLLSAEYPPEVIDDWINKIDIELNTVTPPMYCRWRYCWGVKRDLAEPLPPVGPSAWPASIFTQPGMPATFHPQPQNQIPQASATTNPAGSSSSSLLRPIPWMPTTYKHPSAEDMTSASSSYRPSSPGAESMRSSLTWEREQQALADSRDALVQYYQRGVGLSSHDGSIYGGRGGASPMEHHRLVAPTSTLPSHPAAFTASPTYHLRSRNPRSSRQNQMPTPESRPVASSSRRSVPSLSARVRPSRNITTTASFNVPYQHPREVTCDADEFAFDPHSQSFHHHFPPLDTLSSLPPLPPPPIPHQPPCTYPTQAAASLPQTTEVSQVPATASYLDAYYSWLPRLEPSGQIRGWD